MGGSKSKCVEGGGVELRKRPPPPLSVLTLDVLLELDEVDGAQFLHLWVCGGGHGACFCANRLPVHRREKQ